MHQRAFIRFGIVFCLACVLGTSSCGGSGSTEPESTTTPQTGLIVQNASASCCRFVGVAAVLIETGFSFEFDGYDVGPGMPSPLIPLSPGWYQLRVKRADGPWVTGERFTVVAAQVVTVEVTL